LKLTRVTPGWYESHDGRFSVLRRGLRWVVARFDGTQWVSESFRTKRDAVTEVARRLTHESTNA